MENFATDKLLQIFTQYAMKEGSSKLLSTVGLENLIKDNFAKFLEPLSVVSQHSDTMPTTSSRRRRRSDAETEENQRQLKRIRDIFLAPSDEEEFAGFRPEEALEADYRGVKRVASDSGSESDTMCKKLRDTADNSSDSEDGMEEAVDWTLVQNIRDICNQATSSDNFEGFRDNGNEGTDWQDQALEQKWQAWRGVDASAAGVESDASNESHSSDSE